MRAWIVAAALFALGASAASAADLRLPPAHRHDATDHRHVAIRHACPVGQIDERGAVIDGAALGLRPPPPGYCWLHWGGELRLQSLATGKIILAYGAF